VIAVDRWITNNRMADGNRLGSFHSFQPMDVKRINRQVTPDWVPIRRLGYGNWWISNQIIPVDRRRRRLLLSFQSHSSWACHLFYYKIQFCALIMYISFTSFVFNFTCCIMKTGNYNWLIIIRWSLEFIISHRCWTS
jgi:hypothetical protein